MSEFLVETYAPQDRNGSPASPVEEVVLAAEHVSKNGAEVALLSAILVPEEDICFYLFRSSSARAVYDAMTRAGLQCDRITHAVLTQTQPPRSREEGQTDDPRL